MKVSRVAVTGAAWLAATCAVPLCVTATAWATAAVPGRALLW